MTTANTGAQPTGAMTLEQGVAHMQAKLAERGATVDDTAIVHESDPNEEVADIVEESAIEGEQTEETDTEAVSGDESETKEERDNRPVILPDGSQITVEEARKGYLRQAEFTRKTQDLARRGDEVDNKVARTMDWAKGALQDFEAVVGVEPTPAQMMQLRQSDPQKHAEVQAYWNDVNRIRTERRKAIANHEQRRLAQAQAQSFSMLLEGSFEPAWKDEKTLTKALDTVTEYLADRGLPQEALGKVDHHVWIEVAEESRRYRELQKAKPKAVKAVTGKPKPFIPGSKTAASPQSENLRSLQEAFTRNPNVENAVALEQARAASRRRS